MNQIYILCVEDEPDVLDALIRDLSDFENVFPIEAAASTREARDVIRQIERAGDQLGVIFCDHIMTGENGVELLIDLQRQSFTQSTRKILVTAHAGLDDTIEAVNKAELAHYIAKPWNKKELKAVARKQMTEFVLERKIDPTPFMRYLDPYLLGEAIRGGLLGDT